MAAAITQELTCLAGVRSRRQARNKAVSQSTCCAISQYHRFIKPLSKLSLYCLARPGSESDLCVIQSPRPFADLFSASSSPEEELMKPQRNHLAHIFLIHIYSSKPTSR